MKLLDDAVLQRMEADHHQPPAGRAACPSAALSACSQLLKLGVDENPKSLKCARCRVLARLAGFDRASHELGQLGGGSNRAPALAASNNRLCNLNSKPFFPIVTYHLRNLALVGAWPAIPRRSRRASVSMRMSSGPSKRKLEAARRVVDLRRARRRGPAARRRPASTPSAASVAAIAREALRAGSRSAGRRRCRAGRAATASGSLVERDQPALRRQPLEDQRASGRRGRRCAST